jgi:uncharacterized protein (TIGR02996 family)
VKDELLAAVYAEPDSDDPRVVLADYLLQDGDPFGEFIAKQLSGEHGVAELLLAQHGAEWLGSLRPFTRRAQFQRGFPTRLELGAILTPEVIPLGPLPSERALATVEDLLTGGAHHDAYGALIASPAMTALRRIEIFDPGVLGWLERSPAKIRHVSHAARPGGSSLHELLAICERRPDITSLTVEHNLVDLVLESPIADRLTTLAIRGTLPVHPALSARVPGDLAVTLVPHAALEDCAAGPAPSIGAIEIVSHRVLRAWGEWGHATLRHSLESLLSQVQRLELLGRPAHFDEFERAARHRRFELVVLPEPRRHGYVGERSIRVRSEP